MRFLSFLNPSKNYVFLSPHNIKFLTDNKFFLFAETVLLKELIALLDSKSLKAKSRLNRIKIHLKIIKTIYDSSNQVNKADFHPILIANPPAAVKPDILRFCSKK